jgi:RNA polymerase sigma-70 factor (ECF subfamily)
MASTADDELMRALHVEHSRALWAYALRLTGGDRAAAEDVVQETMLRAWRNPQVLDQSERSARAWLCTVARRVVIDDWRRRGRHGELPADLPESPAPDATEAALDAQLVEQALSRLSREHREVIIECYYRGASVAEAADALGIAEGTVKSRTHYALRALKLALEEIGGAP